ncbi:MAG: nuclease A inhibitor family protein [Cyanobacteria bacterium Co-bin13]|nr:nuclease A inhibitor family protein [Cyanobacteria bacterium Co-bin13]
MTDRDAFVQALRDAIAPKGQPNSLGEAAPTTLAPLLYPSETDAPLDVVIWEINALNPDALRQHLNLPQGTPIEERSVNAFFDRVTCDVPGAYCAWQGPDAHTLAQQYQSLRDLLQTHLCGLTVYRIGAIEITAYVVGQHDPTTWIGITTQIVET